MSKLRSIAVAVVFLVGCAVGGAASRFVVPPASAQQQAAGITRWEYFCFAHAYNEPEQIARKASEAGAAGWEMAATVGGGSGSTDVWCFKRLVGR